MHLDLAAIDPRWIILAQLALLALAVKIIEWVQR